MQLRAQGHELHWDLGIRTHAGQSIRLTAGKLPQQPTWQQAEAFPLPSDTGMSVSKALRKIHWVRRDFQRLLDLEDMEGAWDRLCAAICYFHQVSRSFQIYLQFCK